MVEESDRRPTKKNVEFDGPASHRRDGSGSLGLKPNSTAIRPEAEPASKGRSQSHILGLSLADCHVHLGFMSNAPQVAAGAERDGLFLFVNTVTPREFLELRDQPWTRLPNVRLGVGLHPWWVARGVSHSNASPAPEDQDITNAGTNRNVSSANVTGRPIRVVPSGNGIDSADSPTQNACSSRHSDYADAQDVALAAKLAGQSRWVGEVGLDFSPKHTDPSSHEAQVAALRRILKACAAPLDAGKRTISIHSVASADAVLDLLEETGADKSCNCIFHWFSGSTPALWRAIRLGCWFSVNEMQAHTRRAKEQLKLIPRSHLLLETDFPPQEGEPFSETRITKSLDTACDRLATILGTTQEDVRSLTSRNAGLLLEQ